MYQAGTMHEIKLVKHYDNLILYWKKTLKMYGGGSNLKHGQM